MEMYVSIKYVNINKIGDPKIFDKTLRADLKKLEKNESRRRYAILVLFKADQSETK